LTAIAVWSSHAVYEAYNFSESGLKKEIPDEALSTRRPICHRCNMWLNYESGSSSLAYKSVDGKKRSGQIGRRAGWVSNPHPSHHFYGQRCNSAQKAIKGACGSPKLSLAKIQSGDKTDLMYELRLWLLSGCWLKKQRSATEENQRSGAGANATSQRAHIFRGFS
jgi:hypothetical protein